MPPLPWAEQSIARHHLLLSMPIIRLPYLFIVCLSSSERACMLGRFSRVQLFVTPWTAAHQAPLPMALSQQEHWGGLPFPPSGSLLFHDLNPDHHPPPLENGSSPPSGSHMTLSSPCFQPPLPTLRCLELEGFNLL